MEAVQKFDGEIIASLLLNGDTSKLNQTQKVQYYTSMCQRVGLDPTTQPFKLLKLNGKEVMYCDRSGAQQLNKLHKVSHQRTHTETVAEVYAVYMRATLPDGRFTESCGAVNISGLKGDALANAMMKAETKAKRRSTLDLLGLGMLDESEIETIPSAVRVQEVPVSDDPIGPAVQPEAPKPEAKVNTALEDTPMPGKRYAGKKLKDMGEELAGFVAWCEANQKYPEFVAKARAYMDNPLGFKDDVFAEALEGKK